MLCLRTISEPFLFNVELESILVLLSLTEMLVDSKYKERLKIVFRPAVTFSHICLFFVSKKKITLPDVVILNFIGIVYIYFRQAVQWAVKRAT